MRIALLAVLLLSSAASAAPTITFPTDGKTYKRDRDTNQGDMVITGTYTGSPTGIFAKWGNNPPEKIVASPSGGTFTGTLHSQPGSRDRETLTVYFEGDTGTNDTVANVGMGDIIGLWGQSNMSGRGSTNQVSLYADDDAKRASQYTASGWIMLADPYDHVDNTPAGTDDALAAGSWVIGAVDAYMELNQVTVGIVSGAEGGTTVAQWGVSSNVNSNYRSFYNELEAAGGATELWCWLGETDAINGTAEATFAAAFQTIADSYYAAFGAKTIAAKIHVGTWSNTNVNAAYESLYVMADSNVLRGPDFSTDITTVDPIHFKSQTEIDYAKRKWIYARQNNLEGEPPEDYPYCLEWNPQDFAETGKVQVKTLSDFPSWAVPFIVDGDIVWTNENDNRLFADDDLADYSNDGTTVVGVHGILQPRVDSNARLRAYFGNPTPHPQPDPRLAFEEFWAAYPRGLDEDHSPNGNDLTLQGSPTVGGVAGPIDGSQATSLASASGQKGKSTVKMPSYAPPISLVQHFKPASVSTVQSLLSVSTAGSADNYYMLWLNSSVPGYTARDSQTRNWVGGAVTLGSWQSLVGVSVTSTTRRAYLNGTPVGTGSSVASTPTGMNTISVGINAQATDFYPVDGTAFMSLVPKVAWSSVRADDWSDMFADPDQSDYFGSPNELLGPVKLQIYVGP